MSRSYVYLLFSGSKLASLRTTPCTGLSRGQLLGNPRCYPFLTLLYTLSRQHSELERAHIRETLRQRTQGVALVCCEKNSVAKQPPVFWDVDLRCALAQPGTGQLSLSVQNATPLP